MPKTPLSPAASQTVKRKKATTTASRKAGSVAAPQSARSAAPTDLGERLRDLRKRKRISLQTLADGIGRSIGFVSEVERNLCQISVEDLAQISEVLGVPMTYFYAPRDIHAGPAWITRSKQQRTFSYAQGITDWQLSPASSQRFFMLLTVLEPGAKTGERDILMHHENAGHILEGQLQVILGKEVQTLKAGDTFHLRSGSMVRYNNPGKMVTKILWIYG